MQPIEPTPTVRNDPASPAAEPGDAPLDANLLAAIETALVDFLRGVELPTRLRDACLHAVLGGGKRLRPLLVLESARAVLEARGDDEGKLLDCAMPSAVALELIHAFSLVHDDLPALDNDLVRRGKPTCHVAFGEAMAVLAGDALLALAPISASRSPRGASEIQRELLQATVEMINGQVYDTLGGFPDGLSRAAELELVHRNKTGALLRSACRMGGLAAGASDSQLAGLTSYGESIGLMFQIVDDLIDATQSAEHAGKATGKDADAGKLTYPLVHGLDGSAAEVRRLQAAATAALDPFGIGGARLRALSDFLASRTR